ncbi:MAG TPA: hypothetical protein VIT65_08380, partial [Microlunatus sp.]
TNHQSQPQPVGDQRELLLERTNQLLGGPPGARSRGRVLTQPTPRGEAAGIEAYLTASGDSIDETVTAETETTAEETGTVTGETGTITEAAADVPRTIIVPPKLMRAYQSVARDSAHRADQRLARLLADDPDQ